MVDWNRLSNTPYPRLRNCSSPTQRCKHLAVTCTIVIEFASFILSMCRMPLSVVRFCTYWPRQADPGYSVPLTILLDLF